jgi:hypothetical protein
MDSHDNRTRAAAMVVAAAGLAAAFVAGQKTAAPAPTAGPSPPLPPSPDEFKARWNYLARGMADTRQLLQRQGSALAAALTAIVVGLGYAHFHDFIPLPSGDEWRVGAAMAVGLLALATSVGYLGSVFFSAQRRIMITPSTPSEPVISTRSPLRRAYQRARGRFDAYERKLVRKAYKPYVATYVGAGASPADAYDLRRVQAAADNRRTQGETDIADRLEDIVRLAQLDAAASILEYRSVHAHEGVWTRIGYFAAAISLVGVFLLADYSENQRPASNQTKAQAELAQTQANATKVQLENAKTCAEDKTAGTPLPTDVDCP